MLNFEPGTTECTTRVKITASSYVAFDKKFVLMLRMNALPPSSGRVNLVSVVSGMTGRRECVHYVAVRGGRDSAVGVATFTGWTFRGSNPCGGELFRTHPVRSCGPSSFVHNGNHVFPRGKAVGASR